MSHSVAHRVAFSYLQKTSSELARQVEYDVRLAGDRITIRVLLGERGFEILKERSKVFEMLYEA